MIKWLTNKIKEALIKEFDLRNMYDYVNKENELDIKVISLFNKRKNDLKQINSLRKTVTNYCKYQEVVEKDIAILKKIKKFKKEK